MNKDINIINNRLRVGLDARFATRTPRRGIGNYAVNLINEIVALDASIDFILYIDEFDNDEILPNMPNVRICKLGPSIYPLWEVFSLPLAVIRDNIDILHCLGNTAPLFLSKRIHLVLSIHDVMFLRTGELIPKPISQYQKWGRLYRALLVPIVARRAKRIITVSNFSMNDILISISGILQDEIRTTHLSCDSIFQSKSISSVSCENLPSDIISSSFVLCLGAEDPRKNTLRVVNSYLDLLSKNAISANLVICGYSNWSTSESYQVVRSAKAESKVLFLNYISIENLAILYSKAAVFVYPSLYEGFGIPLLEAFSSGCPVVASNLTSIPEVGGDAVLYFDPMSEEDIGLALLKVVTDSVLREELIARGYVRARQFSWKYTALKTLSVYKECTEADR